MSSDHPGHDFGATSDDVQPAYSCTSWSLWLHTAVRRRRDVKCHRRDGLSQVKWQKPFGFMEIIKRQSQKTICLVLYMVVTRQSTMNVPDRQRTTPLVVVSRQLSFGGLNSVRNRYVLIQTGLGLLLHLGTQC